MSYSDYANIINSYVNKTNQRREQAQSRYSNFKSGFRERGLAALEAYESRANEAYSSAVEKLQEQAIKNLGITEDQRAKAEAIATTGIVGGQLLGKVLDPVKKPRVVKKLKTISQETFEKPKIEKPEIKVNKANVEPLDFSETDRFDFGGDEFGSEAIQDPVKSFSGRQVLSRNLGDTSTSAIEEQSARIIEGDIKPVRGANYFREGIC